MSLRRLRSLPLKRLIPLVVVAIALVLALVMGSIKLFAGGKVAGLFSKRDVLDGLAVAAMAIPAGLYLFLRPDTVRTAAPSRARFDWRWVIPLVALILLAAALRFYKLDFQSLWRDEIASVARVESATLPDALILGNWQDAWPSYHIPVYFFVRLAGDSEFAFRFPSALAGVLLIPVIFVLGRRLFSAREGLIAAGLAIALKAPLWYSQEMRSYAFLMLFAALSAYFWFRMAHDLVWRGRPGRFALVGYLASAILTIYAHYFGLVLIGVEGLGALLLVIHLRRLPLSLAAVYAGIGLAYLPWLPLMVSDLGKDQFWSGRPSWFGGWFFGFLSFVFRSPLVFVALALAALGVALVLWRAWRRREASKALPLAVTPGVVLIAWLVLPYAIAYWRSQVGTPILVNRYLLVSLPPALLLVARAVTRLPLARPIQALAAGVMVVFLLGHIVFGNYYVIPNKTQLREAVRFIADHDSQYPDAVIIAGYQGGKNELDYYFRKDGSSGTIDIKAGNAWQVDDVLAQLAQRKPRYVWFIGQYLFYEKDFADALARDYQPVMKQEFFHVTVFLYRNTGGGS